MAPEKSPAFQFYPRDFLLDGHVASMTLEERGAYITLLCLCWTEITLPIEPLRLARMMGCTAATFKRVWPALEPCFVQADGGLSHKRLEKERAKQASHRQAQKDKADKRWHGPGNATALPKAYRNDALLSAVSDLPSSELVKNTSSLAAHEKIQTTITTGDDGERAGRLVEHYSELFVKHRFGAKYRQRPNLDWHDALTLVPLWDDGRLEKLAILVLTTDDPWISNTDRSFKIFAMKASWADDKLRAWETEHGVAV